MKLTSILAIYLLFWVMSAFLVMPFGVKTHEETGDDKIAGQAESAPANFNPRRIMFRASVLALILFSLYYANYVNAWIELEDLNMFKGAPELDSEYNRA